MADRHRRVAAGPCWISRFAIGLPTMFERPTITACAPLVSIPERTSICCTPYGVAGAERRRGRRSRACRRYRVEAVHVLGRVDPVQDLLAVDVLRQRELDQDAVDRWVGVEPVDDRRAARPRTSSPAGGSSPSACRLPRTPSLGAHVDGARRVVAHEHGREARLPPAALQLRDLCRHLGADRLGQRDTIENPLRSSGVVHRPRLADHHHLDLPRILQLVLDPPRDRLGERRRARVVDPSGVTTTRTSRPAWIAMLFSTPVKPWRSPPAGSSRFT